MHELKFCILSFFSNFEIYHTYFKEDSAYKGLTCIPECYRKVYSIHIVSIANFLEKIWKRVIRNKRVFSYGFNVIKNKSDIRLSWNKFSRTHIETKTFSILTWVLGYWPTKNQIEFVNEFIRMNIRYAIIKKLLIYTLYFVGNNIYAVELGPAMDP